jgi:hypothetical protein
VAEGRSKEDAVGGHLFVVRGRLEHLHSDAQVITTDQRFSVGDHWAPVHGADDVKALMPSGWGTPDVRYGRASDGRPLWFLDVTLAAAESLKDMLLRLRMMLSDVAAADLPTSGRQVPLLAMPVPGIGRGGFHGSSGYVIDHLLRTMNEALAGLDLDVVLVAADPAAYAAVQARRRQVGEWPSFVDGEEVRRLAGLAREGGLALFIGAGVSRAAGLPSWEELLQGLAREPQVAAVRGDGASPLGPLDTAELLQRLLGQRLQSRIVERIGSPQPALGHALLAGLRCREVITTNYDRCYEQAVTAQGLTAPTVVMPWQVPQPGVPWLLKLHGDVDHANDIVLTRGQFVHYDSRWRPAGSMLQAVLLTRHLLVVGASMTDDNVLRLTHEVRDFRQRSGVTGELGTVLSPKPEPLRAKLWDGDLAWHAMGDDLVEGARRLEVFLDVVGAHACDDRAYLLDENFADLLGDEERRVVTGLRSLKRTIDHVVDVAGHRQEWRDLQAALSAMGADGVPARAVSSRQATSRHDG